MNVSIIFNDYGFRHFLWKWIDEHKDYTTDLGFLEVLRFTETSKKVSISSSPFNKWTKEKTLCFIGDTGAVYPSFSDDESPFTQYWYNILTNIEA